MSHQAEAEENLRVIRSLMEKATVYRAISAPVRSCRTRRACGGRRLNLDCESFAWPPMDRFPLRLAVARIARVTGLVNFALLARDASRRGEPFVSPGMRLALRAMLPAMLAGGVVTLLLADNPVFVASSWVLFYGIALLAASHFAPKSICWLGRAFFVTGFLWFASERFVGMSIEDQGRKAHLIMGATFGLFHLIYAACTWPRARPTSRSVTRCSTSRSSTRPSMRKVASAS